MDGYEIKHENATKYSLSGIAFNHIRENILSGVYKENEELREVALAKEIGVSRTPVREALRQLELEGLVSIIPNRGAFVVGISHKDIKDIYLMRSLLEGLCAKFVTNNATEELISELEGIIDLANFYCEKGKVDKVLELDNKFHTLMYDAADSKMLRHSLSDFHHYLETVRKSSLKDINRAVKSIEEHRLIVEAIKEKNANKAEKIANEHILNAMKSIDEHDLW